MQVRRPLSDPAAAGPCKVCLSCPCKKTSQKQKRGAQSLRKRSLHTAFFDLFTVQVERIPLPPDHSAKASYNLRHILHIGNLRAAFQHDLLFCQNRRRDHGKNGIFGTLDCYRSAKPPSAENLIYSHLFSPIRPLFLRYALHSRFVPVLQRFSAFLIGVPRDRQGKPHLAEQKQHGGAAVTDKRQRNAGIRNRIRYNRNI